MKEYSHYNRIVEYDEGHLSDEQQKQFENELNTNAILKKEYELFLEAKSLSDVLQYEQLKKTIGSFQEPLVKVVSFWKKSLAIAASFFLLIAGSFFLYANLKYKDTQLALQFYESPNFSDDRSKAIAETILNKATTAYNQKDFSTAITLSQQITPEQSNYTSAQYLLAHSYFQNHNWAKAVPIFSDLIQSNDERYLESSQWYLALTYLELGSQSKALNLLDQISSQNTHGYKNDAINLKNKLNSWLYKFSF
ncbi:MAG TPA: tetratricopeptide repeat protein [Candidatus Moranbacteria bacterium]|nr:tetratricopeptide repeat protein [Candidatus Moranbacteria bacterium]